MKTMKVVLQWRNAESLVQGQNTLQSNIITSENMLGKQF